MAQLRTLSGTNGVTGTRRVRSSYNIPTPSVKAEVADKLRVIEREAAPARAMNARCCGACKTPYNCGNPGCRCHARLAS